MRSWVVILFVFLTLSNSANAADKEKRLDDKTLTEFLKQFSAQIERQSKEKPPDDKTLQALMEALQARVSNTCQTPEGSCPLPSTAFKVVLHYAHQTHHFTSAWPDTILQAAQKQGIALPYSCNTGRCATCAAHCHKVEQTAACRDLDDDGFFRLSCEKRLKSPSTSARHL